MFGNNADTMLHSTHIFKLPLLKLFSELSPFQRSSPDQNIQVVPCLKKKKKKKDVKRKNLFQLFPGCFNEEPARKDLLSDQKTEQQSQVDTFYCERNLAR